MGRWLIGAVVLCVLVLGAGSVWLAQVNDYRTEGTLSISALSAPVTVTRDANGVAHIAAANRRDMLRAQGFISAQDRLFQMEFFRMLAWGRLSELLGDAGIESDTQMRVFGLPQNAERMAAQFAPDVRQFLSDYLEGVNAYIATQQDEFPVELSLIGHTPEPWTLADSAIVLQYIGFRHSVNMKAEALTQALIDRVGVERAMSLMPINVNPDRNVEAWPARLATPESDQVSETVAPTITRRVEPVVAVPLGEQLAPLHFGSNNWAVGPEHSASGAATVVNDPHLDARLLPGVWYPIGLSTPDFHAAGVALPAIPGIMVGRNDRVGFGVTNAYGDVQDLFIETVDASADTHYLDGGVSMPFETRVEILRVKDESADSGFREEPITIRATRRGPVVSDHGLVNLGGRVVTLRWGGTVGFGPEIGFDKLFYARSAAEADAAAQLMDIHMFNLVYADVEGNFGRRATGKIPIRRVGEGVAPVPVTDAGPYWLGWIPKDAMPGEFNPARGWTGTANHDTRPSDYPYTYSTYFSASYRYRRLIELMDSHPRTSAEDHWSFMHDVRNLQAAGMVPQLLGRLRDAGFDSIAQVLADWSFDDRPDDHAPLVYQTLYRELVQATFADELGESLSAELLGNWYYWQERFDQMVLEGESAWFDDVSTPVVEGLQDVVMQAAERTQDSLAGLGTGAVWGDVHQLTFTSPMRQQGIGSGWLGGGTYPMSGSGETLRRARYPFHQPFDTAFFASYMLVADMAEAQTIMTALPGGVAARVLHPHYASQIPAWHAGSPTRSPLTRADAQGQAVSTLTLVPAP